MLSLSNSRLRGRRFLRRIAFVILLHRLESRQFGCQPFDRRLICFPIRRTLASLTLLLVKNLALSLFLVHETGPCLRSSTECLGPCRSYHLPSEPVAFFGCDNLGRSPPVGPDARDVVGDRSDVKLECRGVTGMVGRGMTDIARTASGPTIRTSALSGRHGSLSGGHNGYVFPHWPSLYHGWNCLSWPVCLRNAGPRSRHRGAKWPTLTPHQSAAATRTWRPPRGGRRCAWRR